MGDCLTISKSTLDANIAKLQKELIEGTEKAARNLICAGTFIVMSDVAYRIATAKVNIDIEIPSMSEMFKNFNPLDIGKSILENKDPTSIATSLFKRTDIDFTVETEGLWDVKYTCYGVGFVAAGTALMGANHPEWISESIDRAQKLVETAENAMIKILENKSLSGSDMGVEDLTGLATAIVPLLGAAATVAPGIPPPP